MGELDKVLSKLRQVFEVANIRPVEWDDGKVKWLNVSLLPWEEKIETTTNIERLAEAIKNLEIRGAPAIGVAAALGIAMAAYNTRGNSKDIMENALRAANILSKTRPTAYNLFWAINRMKKKIVEVSDEKPEIMKEKILSEALKIQLEDIEANIKMGDYGEKLIQDGDTILTHCNTGALATAGYGTALGVIRSAWRKGKKINVIATETRPLLQGARLTAWELKKEGIPFKLITDNMIGYVFMKKIANKVILGADRILLTGHVTNKIGTYTIAVLARRHGAPFYSAAPTSTIDPSSKPEQIKIEERDPKEVTTIMGRLTIAPEGVDALNPAFDVTPPELVSGIITEKGIAFPPYEKNLSKYLINR